jgi:hypothetical protein
MKSTLVKLASLRRNKKRKERDVALCPNLERNAPIIARIKSAHHPRCMLCGS